MILYSTARELVPGNLPTMTLALDLASTLSRQWETQLILGPLAYSDLEAVGLSTSQSAEHGVGVGVDDLEAWVAAVTRPGDVVVVPVHDPSVGPALIRVFRSGRSVLAVSQNPEISAASVVSPMNLPVGRSLGT